MIRKATSTDLPEVTRIYAAAKKFMCENGNPTQWPGSYPDEDLVLEDITNENLYLICSENGDVCACFGLFFGDDPTYLYIEGKWRSDTPYAAIHRVASDGSIRGVFRTAFEFASKTYSHIRIDTHEDNTAMRNAIEKCGFVYCGTIYVENGTPRRAYEWIRE